MQTCNTLTEAMQLRARPGAVGLVLSLEGAVYFVFHSLQTREQVANSSSGKQVGILGELKARFANTPYVPTNAQDHQAKYHELKPFALANATEVGVEVEGRHAEEAMIERWDDCVAEFVRRRSRFPNAADIFLTHSPCRPENLLPSPRRVLHDAVYSVSCSAKLPEFCSTGDRIGMKWRVYWDLAFGGLPGTTLNQGNLIIQVRPSYITLPPG